MAKPLTPTKAGWAQSFDTSMLAQAMYEDRERKRQRFEKNVKTFDPSAVWYRDMPEFSRKVNEYYSYIGEKYDALTNPSRNIEEWQKMKELENDLLNFSSASKAMGQQVKQAQNFMLQRPEYDTDSNRQLIDDVITGKRWGGLDVGYQTGEALNPTFMNEFNKNIFVDIQGMTDILQEKGVEGKLGTPRIVDGRRKEARRSIDFDQGQLTEIINNWWEGGFVSPRGKITGPELQRKYNGNIQEFAQDVSAGITRFGEWEAWTEPAETDGRKSSQFDVSIKPTTNKVAGSQSVPKYTTNFIGKKKKTGTTEVDYNYKTYSQGGVSISGTQAAYKWNAGAGGFDMSGGTWSNTKLAEDGRMVLLGVDHGSLAKMPITFRNITLQDDQGNDQKMTNYQLPKGAPLSEEMIKAVNSGHQAFITDENGNEIPLTYVNGAKAIWEGQVAYANSMSDVTGIDFDDPSSFYTALSRPGHRKIAMPWDDFKKQSTIPDNDIQEIEAGLGTYATESQFGQSTAKAGDDLSERMRKVAEDMANNPY